MKCKGHKQFIPTQFSQMSIRAAGAALGDHFIVYQADAELVNALVLGTSIILQSSTLAARPAASIAGRLYSTTDEGILYRDNGASWDRISTVGYSRAGSLMYGNSGGAKQTRVLYGAIAVGATLTITVTWGTAFADSFYTVIATAEDPIVAASMSCTAQNKLAASVDIVVKNNSGVGSNGGTIHVIAFHD